MLITAAAQTWNVPENQLTTDKGQVIHQTSGRRIKYGELVDKAATLTVPQNAPLKPPTAFKLLGKDLARMDIPEKVNGKAEFGIDVKRPGMLVARVVRCPVHGGKVASFDATKAKAVPGVRNVVQISTGVAVVADGYWAATKGAQALTVQWNEGPMAAVSSEGILKQFAARQSRAQ
jgi:isoquinoline 1-oxidoreductase beta subunit